MVEVVAGFEESDGGFRKELAVGSQVFWGDDGVVLALVEINGMAEALVHIQD